MFVVGIVLDMKPDCIIKLVCVLLCMYVNLCMRVAHMYPFLNVFNFLSKYLLNVFAALLYLVMAMVVLFCFFFFAYFVSAQDIEIKATYK